MVGKFSEGLKFYINFYGRLNLKLWNFFTLRFTMKQLKTFTKLMTTLRRAIRLRCERSLQWGRRLPRATVQLRNKHPGLLTCF